MTLRPLFLLLFILVTTTLAQQQQEKSLVTQADEAFRENNLDLALELYNNAINQSPNEFLYYFKRATVYLSQKDRTEEALSDLEKVIANKPEFFQAKYRHGKTLILSGRYQEARKDFDEVLLLKPGYGLAQDSLKVLQDAQNLEAEGRLLYRNSQHREALDVFSRLLEISPDYLPIRALRAECALNVGEHPIVLEDTKRMLKKDVSDSKAYLYRGKVLIDFGDVESATKVLSQGLKFDPDNKPLKDTFKHANNYLKAARRADNHMKQENWEDAISDLNTAIQFFPDSDFVRPLQQSLCEAYYNANKFDLAIEFCSKILEKDEHNVECLCTRAEAHLKKENFDAAVHDFNKARNIQPNNRRVVEGLNNAQNLLKKSKQKDLYKVLGLGKEATPSEIKKAYRKLALDHHPDKADASSKEEAQKRFQEINEAYEILSDPETKRKYDLGEDLQQGPSHHHQHGGFNPFGGGGGPFSFHFEFRH